MCLIIGSIHLGPIYIASTQNIQDLDISPGLQKLYGHPYIYTLVRDQ